ncbi:MAG: hypothetical protein HQ593_04495 [Candidatus Omnitrophica bacterium]|nr:hypothetical protein [Candidatus Omnitrophota bacterium]
MVRNKWDRGSLFIIATFLVILILRWTKFPIFLDMYYHLSCALGFDRAGGIVTHDFWEFAPLGRPHMYPPFLHILMLGFYKIGFSPLSIARLISVLLYPTLLASAWYVMRWFSSSPRTAFFALLLSTIPYGIFLVTTNTIAASLVVIMALFSFILIERNRLVAATILLGLAFYTHVMLAFFMAMGLLIYGSIKREKLYSTLMVIGIGSILALPWLTHLWNNRAYFTAVSAYENRYLELYPLNFLLGGIGIALILKKRREGYFLIALLLAILPMAIKHRYRFLCGQGLFILSLMGGFSLEAGYAAMRRYIVDNKNRAIYLVMLPVVLVLALTFITPSIIVDSEKGSAGFNPRNSTFTNLVPGYREADEFRANEVSIYHSRFTSELVGIIESNTKADDIILCNYSYVGGLLSVLTGRAISTGMLYEVMPIQAKFGLDPVKVSSLVVWIKDPEKEGDKIFFSLVKKFKLKRIAETDIAYIYRNPKADTKSEVSDPIISLKLVYLLLLASFVAILWDIMRKK